MRGALLLLALPAVAACSRGDAPDPKGSAAVGSSSTPATRALPEAAAAAASPPAATSWSGRYSATVGSLTVPEWTGVRFRGEDASVGLGEGTITVALDEHGRATGSIDGALGTTRIDGSARGNDFGATLVPGDAVHGFSGTAIGTRAGDHIEGTMRLSLATGNVIREASFSLDRKP